MAQTGGIEDLSTEQLDRVVKTNLYAMFWLCKKALPHMSAESNIINTASIQASVPAFGQLRRNLVQEATADAAAPYAVRHTPPRTLGHT